MEGDPGIDLEGGVQPSLPAFAGGQRRVAGNRARVSGTPMRHTGIGRGVRPQDLGIGSLIERVRDAVVVADAKTQRIVLWNPAAEKMFGYSPSEALEMRVEALVPGSLKARHRAGIARYAETGHGPLIDSDTPLDLPALRKDGQEIRVELSLSPVGLVHATDDPVGGGRFVLAIIRDATERRRAEEAIQRLNETLEARVAERTAQLAEREHQLSDLVGKRMVAQEEERRRVAYEVHDGLTQVAIAAHLYLHPGTSRSSSGSAPRHCLREARGL
jgi:PAS domain S-box-containing protein